MILFHEEVAADDHSHLYLFLYFGTTIEKEKGKNLIVTGDDDDDTMFEKLLWKSERKENVTTRNPTQINIQAKPM